MCYVYVSSDIFDVSVGDKTSKLSAVASDGDFWMSKVLKTIETLEKDTKHLVPLVEVDEDQVLYQKAQDVVAKLGRVCHTH
jgi:DNA polymerase phi